MAPIVTNGNFNAVTKFTPIAVVGVAENDVFNAVGHGLLDGQEVFLYGLEGGVGLTEGVHYVIEDNSDNFQLSVVRGGDPAEFSTDITAGYVLRTGAGVPTGWTITKAGSSEFVAGADEALSPSKMPINTYAEIKVDATPGACNGAQAITLAPLARYRLSLEATWDHEDPAEVDPAHAPTIALRATGQAAYLTAAGVFQAGAATIPIPVKKARGSRLAVVFETPATHTAYTVTIDKGTMDGTAGYLEIVRITNVRIEPVAFDDSKLRPENNDAAFDALPQNS